MWIVRGADRDVDVRADDEGAVSRTTEPAAIVRSPAIGARARELEPEHFVVLTP